MNRGWIHAAGPGVTAGLLTVIVECTLLFSLFLTGISLGVSRLSLGVTMGVCAALPYLIQRFSSRAERAMLDHLPRLWQGSLALVAALGVVLILGGTLSATVILCLLCILSALFFLLFQLFELHLSLSTLAGTLTARQANLALQVVMTVGSALGGFAAGHVLHAGGLRGIGIVTVLLTLGAAAAVQVNARRPLSASVATTAPAPSRETAPTRSEQRVAFVQLTLLAAAPATLNFLLPWLVTAENRWSAAQFGTLDLLAASGAFLAIAVFTALRSSLMSWLGVACFAVAAIALLTPDSMTHLSVTCLLWGMGMNLARMRARQTFFLAIDSARDALSWTQRLGLSRVLVESCVPILLGLWVSAPSQLFLALACFFTGALIVLNLTHAIAHRGALTRATP